MKWQKATRKSRNAGNAAFCVMNCGFVKTAKEAVRYGADYFCTTLSISPHKNAGKLMEIGERLAKEYNIPYLPSDFKKKNGYKRSIELSREYDLYRQNYCGCVFSRQQAEKEGRNNCEKPE